MIDKLFDSAHAALTFAFHFSGQSYDRPAMNRMASPVTVTGKGLVGLDGAAQAGMIRAEVHALGALPEAILIARFAPASLPCECGRACCSGHKQNPEWRVAISVIADRCRNTALAGCVAHGGMRGAYVARYFSGKAGRETVEAMARRFGVHEDTVAAHVRRIAVWLGGKLEKGREPTPGLEALAQAAITDRLIVAGIIPG